MGSQNTLTDDLTPPRRPSLDDVGGAAKLDTTTAADPNTMIVASDANQWAKQIVASRKATPFLVIYVRYSGGNPVIDSFATPGDNIVAGAVLGVGGVNLTIARTGGGAANGDVTISWSANTFPQQATAQPWGVLLNDLLGTNRAPSAQAVSNGVRVVTTNGAAAATDIAFTLTIG